MKKAKLVILLSLTTIISLSACSKHESIPKATTDAVSDTSASIEISSEPTHSETTEAESSEVETSETETENVVKETEAQSSEEEATTVEESSTPEESAVAVDLRDATEDIKSDICNFITAIGYAFQSQLDSSVHEEVAMPNPSIEELDKYMQYLMSVPCNITFYEDDTLGIKYTSVDAMQLIGMSYGSMSIGFGTLDITLGDGEDAKVYNINIDDLPHELSEAPEDLDYKLVNFNLAEDSEVNMYMLVMPTSSDYTDYLYNTDTFRISANDTTQYVYFTISKDKYLSECTKLAVNAKLEDFVDNVPNLCIDNGTKFMVYSVEDVSTSSLDGIDSCTRVDFLGLDGITQTQIDQYVKEHIIINWTDLASATPEEYRIIFNTDEEFAVYSAQDENTPSSNYGSSLVTCYLVETDKCASIHMIPEVSIGTSSGAVIDIK